LNPSNFNRITALTARYADLFECAYCRRLFGKDTPEGIKVFYDIYSATMPAITTKVNRDVEIITGACNAADRKVPLALALRAFTGVVMLWMESEAAP
jgi:hypothetical protein